MRLRTRAISASMFLALLMLSAHQSAGQALPTSAKVDTEPLELTEPARYRVDSVLEPIRRVTLVAPADGLVRSQDARAGDNVTVGKEIAQLDRAEAGAHLKIAQAELREQELFVEEAKESTERTPGAKSHAIAVAHAKLEAGKARVELAQLAFDRCSLRAPFSGKILESPISDGQFVIRGKLLAELADVSSLRVLVPVKRVGAALGASVNLLIEGQPVVGKIQALLPLPDSLEVLRELASPFAAAWVVVPNAAATLEPGQRAISPDLPISPIASIPSHALKVDPKGKEAATTVQVIRNEYVQNIRVRVLGALGPDRSQVTGPLRPTDALIVSTSVPLLAGTLIRFNANAGAAAAIEPTSPNPAISGTSVNLTPPTASASPGVAPIGAPGSALPKPRATRTAPAAAPAETPAAKPAGGNPVPF